MDKESKPALTPQYNFDIGNGEIVNLAEGLSPQELEEIQKALDEDPRTKEGQENAVTESEEAAKPAEEEVKEEEPEKPPEEETPETKPELKFKIKRFGQEIDLDLTQDQDRLKTLIQCGYDYEERRKELDRDKAFLRANKQILESDRFKEFLETEQAEGRFVPEAPAPVDRTALAEYAIRKLDPDFDVIRERMAAVAIDLGEEVQSAVDSDYGAFVRFYDRVATDARKKAEPPPVQAPPPEKSDKSKERLLAAKEARKEKAVLEPPGGGNEPEPEVEKWKKRDAFLSEKFKKSGRDEDAMALIMHRQYIK
jgi:hypothetical protein